MQFAKTLILFLFLVSASQAQETLPSSDHGRNYIELEGWEPDDLEHNETLYQESRGLVSPISSFSLALIKMYQKKNSPNSTTHRCPFKISCSNFAYRSISEKWLLTGLLLFVDRYHYRENLSAPYNYPLYENQEGILKLNDDYYLTGEKY